MNKKHTNKAAHHTLSGRRAALKAIKEKNGFKTVDIAREAKVPYTQSHRFFYETSEVELKKIETAIKRLLTKKVLKLNEATESLKSLSNTVPENIN